MIKKFFSIVVAIVFLILSPAVTFAAGPFYEGKTIRIIVGYSPGGGYDVTARAIARHMGRHIPGNPTIFVENMPGAGSLISANYLYNVAKPDGLTIAHFIGTLFLNQAMGEPGIEFDARKFKYIGVPFQGNPVFVLTKSSGITSIEKWMASKTPIKLGGMAPGVAADNVTRVTKAALGLPINLVSGYKGTAEMRLAAEGGEIAGFVVDWDSLRPQWPKGLETGIVVVVLQAVPKPIPDLPNVPLVIDLAKTDEGRQLIRLGIHSSLQFTRPFVLPPGTPKEQEQILSKAFQETLKDKEFLGEAEKMKMSINPATGEELEKTIADLFKANPSLLVKLKEILFK